MNEIAASSDGARIGVSAITRKQRLAGHAAARERVGEGERERDRDRGDDERDPQRVARSTAAAPACRGSRGTARGRRTRRPCPARSSPGSCQRAEQEERERRAAGDQQRLREPVLPVQRCGLTRAPPASGPGAAAGAAAAIGAISRARASPPAAALIATSAPGVEAAGVDRVPRHVGRRAPARRRRRARVPPGRTRRGTRPWSTRGGQRVGRPGAAPFAVHGDVLGPQVELDRACPAARSPRGDARAITLADAARGPRPRRPPASTLILPTKSATNGVAGVS